MHGGESVIPEESRDDLPKLVTVGSSRYLGSDCPSGGRWHWNHFDPWSVHCGDWSTDRPGNVVELLNDGSETTTPASRGFPSGWFILLRFAGRKRLLDTVSDRYAPVV